jgi:Selenocysteine synthase N terminal.
MDCLLGMPDMEPFLESMGREAVKTVLGEALDSLRKKILERRRCGAFSGIRNETGASRTCRRAGGVSARS